MRHGPRAVTIAAALLLAATTLGCGLAAQPPTIVSVTPPAMEPDPAAVAAPPSAVDRGPLSPPVEVPLAPVPTVVGPYVPPEPQPTPVPTTSIRPTPPPAPTPTPPSLLALLPTAAQLPPLPWPTESGEGMAAWSELAPGTMLEPGTAIAHVAAASSASDACAASAVSVTGTALEAAGASFAADPVPGAPVELVLVRAATPGDAALALEALQLLGQACAGIATDDGVLEPGMGEHGPTVLLRSGASVLVVEAIVSDALLVAVLHRGAPPEAVAALLASPR